MCQLTHYKLQALRYYLQVFAIFNTNQTITVKYIFGWFTIWTGSMYSKVKEKVAQSCPTLCDTIAYTVHGILQARILEWVAVPFSGVSSQPRDWTQVSCIAGRVFTSWATREAQEYWSGWLIPSPADLPDPGIEPGSPALQVDSLPTELSGKLCILIIPIKEKVCRQIKIVRAFHLLAT